MSLASHLATDVDIYCERTDFSFWAEPVNALTNSGFMIVAIYLWLLWRAHIRGGPHALRMGVLVALVAWIGIGSFTFHTVAKRWAEIFDVLPIALFIFAYLRILLFHVFSMSRAWVVMVSVTFVMLSGICAVWLPADLANGSGGYIAALILFSSVVMACYQKRKPFADHMLVACLLFWVSLFLRTMDNAWCDFFPQGTHFLWHLLNAVVLALMMRFLVFNLVRTR